MIAWEVFQRDATTWELRRYDTLDPNPFQVCATAKSLVPDSLVAQTFERAHPTDSVVVVYADGYIDVRQ